MMWPDAYMEIEDDTIRWADVGKLARRYRRRIVGAARAGDRPSLYQMLITHLGDDVDALQVVEEGWAPYDQVNMQIGLEAWLSEDGRSHELVGIAHYHQSSGLTDLLRPSPDEEYGPVPGNVTWMNVASGPGGQVRQAVRVGLYLVEDGGGRAAILVRAADPEFGMSSVQMHVVADRPGAAADIAGSIRALALEHNVFRGQVISFGREMFERATVLQFHIRPSMSEGDVILPAETMAMIRRQVVGIAEHREKLLAARQHLKRGLLLYGPPGVGKTHSVRYLMGQLTDVTIIELSGDSLSLISQACSVARTLQPAMIVVEDVDLIAEDRGMYPGGNPLLFQLLNEMDGLAEDSDVVFLLTTNRADVLESALAARPGRVDQAVALDLPDAHARRRLFDLYRGDLVIDESNLDSVIERTDQVTASFLKELLRRAALYAADDAHGHDGPLSVSAGHLDAALNELLDTRNAMTRVLLGGARPVSSRGESDFDESDGPYY